MIMSMIRPGTSKTLMPLIKSVSQKGNLLLKKESIVLASPKAADAFYKAMPASALQGAASKSKQILPPLGDSLHMELPRFVQLSKPAVTMEETEFQERFTRLFGVFKP